LREPPSYLSQKNLNNKYYNIILFTAVYRFIPDGYGAGPGLLEDDTTLVDWKSILPGLAECDGN
jgi:hypothetical protein